MGSYRDIEGNLITLALMGEFDVIAHGCNCRSTMGAGIAVSMARTFGCDKFKMELIGPTIDKLGNIDYERRCVFKGNLVPLLSPDAGKTLYVVNAYTQNYYGVNHHDGKKSPVDYEAITLCMKKMNEKFMGMHIGLPKIGAGLAGGDWNVISEIIKRELKDCRVTIVTLPK
jgi:O-acetyl-ADP-ribose deacetylase (regulator of RNase III)